MKENDIFVFTEKYVNLKFKDTYKKHLGKIFIIKDSNICPTCYFHDNTPCPKYLVVNDKHYEYLCNIVHGNFKDITDEL